MAFGRLPRVRHADPYASREGAREGYEHAFAEPLVGLVQYRSSRQFDKDYETVLWKPEWVKDDVYRLHQDSENLD